VTPTPRPKKVLDLVGPWPTHSRASESIVDVPGLDAQGTVGTLAPRELQVATRPKADAVPSRPLAQRISPSAKAVHFKRRKRAQAYAPGAEGRRSPSISSEVPAERITLHQSHGCHSQAAFEIMRTIQLQTNVPKLPQRFTQYHGTRVPIFILLNLKSAEIGSIAGLDHFWRRCASDAGVWRGVHCRDYGAGTEGCNERCMWRTLHGRRGTSMCVFHLPKVNQAEFKRVCKRITAIPGRSNEELLKSYREWREKMPIVTDEDNVLGVDTVVDSFPTLHLGPCKSLRVGFSKAETKRAPVCCEDSWKTARKRGILQQLRLTGVLAGNASAGRVASSALLGANATPRR